MSGMDSRPIPAVRPAAPAGGPGDGQRIGAIALPPRRRGFDWLPLAILGLLVLTLFLFVAAARTHDRTHTGRAAPSASPPRPVVASGGLPGAPASAGPPQAAGAGQPVVLEAAQLPAYVDMPVHAQADVVQSIAGVGPDGEPDDELFFVGSSPQHQILIDIEVATEPPLAIVAGQKVSFNGVLRKYSSAAANLHLSAPAARSAAQLGYYVVVDDAAQVQAG